MKKLSKDYILTTLAEEHLWKVGEKDTFKFRNWSLTLRKEEEKYAPYKYALNGKKNNSLETWSRRYYSMEDTFKHILNNFNENANIRNEKDLDKLLKRHFG